MRGRHGSASWRERRGSGERWSLAVTILLSTLPYLLSASALRAQVPTDELHGDCLFCHVTDSPTDASLIITEPEVCRLCHSPHNDHAVLVEPTGSDPSLPLTNGLMTCITCHDPHAPQPLQLRLPTVQLCAACHAR